jgi:HD superfamily phosphodiesterase
MAEESFAGILRRKNPELHKCMEELRHRAEEEWLHLLKPDHGSHSGLIHLRNVERNTDKMVPAQMKEQFSDGEIFLLLASVLLHDIGRIIPDRPRREILVRWSKKDDVS